MKLKALLLGSAAAMIAVTGVRAADAVIAEPEPVEYVRVCDMYGAGFFYIPGTETCLRVSGFVRSQYEYTDRDGQVSLGEASFEARVNFDAREETDYGRLRSYIRLEAAADNDGSGRGVLLNQAYIQLGGFETGYKDSRYIETYGHVGLMLDGAYNFQRVGYADYTFAANGFSATAGVQLDARLSSDTFGDTLDATGTVVNRVITAQGAGLSAEKSFDPYLFATYGGSIFSVSGGVAYDTSAEVLAYRARVDLTPIEGLAVGAFYYGSEDPGSSIEGNEHVAGAYAAYRVSPALRFAVGYDYVESHASVETNRYIVGVDWTPVQNMTVRANYRHTDIDGANNDSDEFRVRIERSF